MERKVKYRTVVDIYPTDGRINYFVDDQTVNYCFPVNPKSTYTITIDEVGNRLRSVFTTTDPRTLTANLSGATNIVMNPTFDVGYQFSYTPSEWGYITVYVSNAGEHPNISVVSNCVGGDSEHEYQTVCVENTSGTTQSASIKAYNKGVVLATVSTRSTMTHPDGWKVLHETAALSSDNTSQRMAFLCREIDADEQVTFTATQETSARIYINLIVVSDCGGFRYESGNEYLTEVQTNSHATEKVAAGTGIWGCTANLWDSASTHERWACAEIVPTVIALPTSVQGRQGNFLDTGEPGTRTFLSGSVTTGAIIDYVIVLPPYDRKYLIRSGSTLYTVTDGSLSALTETTPTADVFRTYGVDDIPAGSLLVGLSDPEILYWHDSVDDLPTLTAAVQGVPPTPQIVTTNEQDMSDSSILGIQSATVEASEDVLFALSFDDGTTWKAYDGSQWVTVDRDNAGMTKSTIEQIGLEAWAEVVTSTAYRLRFALISTDSYVKSVVIHYLNKEAE